MLASRVSVGGRSLRFCCSSSFHSAQKRLLKADKKAKEKEKKQQVEPVAKVTVSTTINLNKCLCYRPVL